MDVEERLRISECGLLLTALSPLRRRLPLRVIQGKSSKKSILGRIVMRRGRATPTKAPLSANTAARAAAPHQIAWNLALGSSSLPRERGRGEESLCRDEERRHLAEESTLRAAAAMPVRMRRRTSSRSFGLPAWSVERHGLDVRRELADSPSAQGDRLQFRSLHLGPLYVPRML